MPAPLVLDLYVSPYCPRCESVLEDLASLRTVRGRPVTIRKRDVLEHLDSAVAAGVRSTPAFVLDGRLLASGRLTPERLRKILQGLPTGEHQRGAHDQ
jgi:predicted DsbA family dithiol-disulfide isomerase